MDSDSDDGLLKKMKKQKLESTDEVDDGIHSLPDETVDCFVNHTEPRLLFVYERQEKDLKCSSCEITGSAQTYRELKNWTKCTKCNAIYCDKCDQRWVHFQK